MGLEVSKEQTFIRAFRCCYCNYRYSTVYMGQEVYMVFYR